MTLLVTNDSQRVWEFMHAKLALHNSADFRGALWVPEEHASSAMSMDHVAVAVGYNAFIGRTCCMHVVIQAPERLTPRIVRESFRFPFELCNCNAVLGLVDSKNDAAMSFDLKLGFKQIATIPNGGIDGDLNVLQMLRGECRWLKPH